MKIKSITIASLLILAMGSIHAQVITVDNYYNQETKTDKTGQKIGFHYLWNDTTNTGFSILGAAFKKAGAKALHTLSEAPTAKNLKGTAIFIIVDPDHLKDNPKPNYMNEADAEVIARWVQTGGVLFLLANDEKNCDLEHFNLLAAKFGFSFNKDLILHVTDDQHFSSGELNTEHVPLFKTAKRIFVKDASSISIAHTAKPVLKTIDGKHAMVSATYGKGTVLAIGDPWLYNEYVNGRLPATYENDKAASDIALWLISRIKK
jgi:hypothetical protein